MRQTCVFHHYDSCEKLQLPQQYRTSVRQPTEISDNTNIHEKWSVYFSYNNDYLNFMKVLRIQPYATF